MAALDLHAAANVTGCSRSTLKRALVAGRIVGRRDDRGRWRIDRAELARFIEQQRAAHEPQSLMARRQDDAKNH